MAASDYWTPPADSADLESYTALTLRRSALPSFGSAVPPREAYSRKCPGVNFGDDDVLVLDATNYRRLIGAGWRYTPPKPRPVAHAARYDFLSGPQFICLMSTPVWAFAMVWLMGWL